MPTVLASLIYLATTPLDIFNARAVASKLSLALKRYLSTSLILRMDSLS